MNLREDAHVRLNSDHVPSDRETVVAMMGLLIGWLVVVPSLVVLLRLRRARLAEAAPAPATPAPRACEARHRTASAVRTHHPLRRG